MIQRFVSDSLAYGSAAILSRATLLVSLLVLPLIMTPRDYGALGMIVTVAALVAIALPAEIGQGLARFHTPAPPEEKRAWAGSAWTYLLALLAASLLVGQIFAGPLCRLVLGDLSYLPAFRLALLFMALNCLFQFLQNLCRWEFRTAQYVLISLVFALLTLAGSIGLALLVDPPLVGVMIGQAIGAAVAAALGVFALRPSLALRIDRKRLLTMLRFSLPLATASLAIYLSVYASRFVLNGLMTLEEVGLYTLAAQIAGIASLGIAGVQAALTPLVTAYHGEPRTPAHLARLFEIAFGLAAVGCLLLGLLAPEAIHFFGHPDYARAGPLVLLLAPGLILAQMYVFAPGFWIARRTTLQMGVSIAGALFALAVNLVLIRVAGLAGAAAATLLSGAAFLALWFAFSQRLYPVPVRWGLVALAAGATVLLGLAGTLTPYDSLAAGLALKLAIVAVAAALVVMIGLVPIRESLAVLGAISARRTVPSAGRG